MQVKSEKLDSHLESHKTENLKEKLSLLESMWINPEILAQFHTRIEGILEKNPDTEDLISWELGKLSLSLEHTQQNYTRSFRSILDSSANNPNWNPDESLVA